MFAKSISSKLQLPLLLATLALAQPQQNNSDPKQIKVPLCTNHTCGTDVCPDFLGAANALESIPRGGSYVTECTIGDVSAPFAKQGSNPNGYQYFVNVHAELFAGERNTPDDCFLNIRSVDGSVDDGRCGSTVFTARKAGCYPVSISGTNIAMTYCCAQQGQGDVCKEFDPAMNTGKPGEKRMVKRSSSSGTRIKRNLRKREGAFPCETVQIVEGTYTRNGPQKKVSNVVSCNAAGGCPQAISHTTTVTWTGTAGVTFSIPELFSVNLGFSVSESKAHQYTYTFNLGDGQTGYIAWTPTMECRDIVAIGCPAGAELKDGDKVTACTPKMSANGDESVEGKYNLVGQGR